MPTGTGGIRRCGIRLFHHGQIWYAHPKLPEVLSLQSFSNCDQETNNVLKQFTLIRLKPID